MLNKNDDMIIEYIDPSNYQNELHIKEFCIDLACCVDIGLFFGLKYETCDYNVYQIIKE